MCSTGNVELARSLGADRVVDYTHEDFTRSGARYDLLLDVAGSRSRWAYKRVLADRGTVVLVGGRKRNRWLGPLSQVLKVLVASRGQRQRAAFFVASFKRADFETLREMLESGKVTPVIDRTYPLDRIAEGLRYLGEGHARGKVAITV